jgi:hypothetical protein
MENGILTKSTDEVRLRRSLVSVLLFIAVIVLAGFILRTGNLAYMAGFVALPFLIILLRRPDVAVVLGLACQIVSIRFLPILEASYLFYGVAITDVFLVSIFMRNRPEKRRENFWLGFFALVIFMLMALRGTGLRFLGSDTWGGFPYVLLLISIFIFIKMRGIKLSGKHIKWIVTLMIFMAAGNTLLAKAGFAVEEASEVSQGRLSWVSSIGTVLFAVAFLFRRDRRVLRILFWIFAVGIVGLTGFRGRFLGLLGTTALYVFFDTPPEKKKSLLIKAVLGGLLVWGFAFILAPHLPIGLQRTLTILPGIKAGAKVMQDTLSSNEWRFEVWEFCLEQVPKYLLVGRGVTFDVSTAVEQLGWGDIGAFSPWFAFVTHTYHSGPLALLIDFGLPGLLGVLCFHILVTVKCFRSGLTRPFRDTLYDRFTLFWMASLLTNIGSYYFIYGKPEYVAATIIKAATVYLLLENRPACSAPDTNDPKRLKGAE